MPLALFVISLVFSALISILYFVQILSRLSARASSSCPSSAKASIPSANRRLVIFVLKDCYLRTLLGSDKNLLNLYLKTNEGLFLNFKIHNLKSVS